MYLILKTVDGEETWIAATVDGSEEEICKSIAAYVAKQIARADRIDPVHLAGCATCREDFSKKVTDTVVKTRLDYTVVLLAG